MLEKTYFVDLNEFYVGQYNCGVGELEVTQRNQPGKPCAFIDGDTEAQRKGETERGPKRFME